MSLLPGRPQEQLNRPKQGPSSGRSLSALAISDHPEVGVNLEGVAGV